MKAREFSSKELYNILKKTVVGQDEYLKKVAVTVWLHNKRIEATRHNTSSDCPEKLQKHNLLCVGPTGSGKTLALQQLADLYGFDLMVYDASNLTGAGWKGKGIEDILFQLYVACDQNKKRVESSIVVLDEIDKMLLNKDNSEKSFCAENSLLKFIEGDKFTFEFKNREKIIDTSNILFIGSGAFEGIEEFVRRRTCKKISLGFGTPDVEPSSAAEADEDLYHLITKEDIISYGMGVQLAGRFHDFVVLNKLSVSDLTSILLQSNASVIKSLNTTLSHTCGIGVDIDPVGAEAVAREAAKETAGARGLAQIIIPVINDTLFLLEEEQNVNRILITATDNGEPAIRLFEGARNRYPFTTRDTSVEQTVYQYSFPNRKRKNVEHFVNHIIGLGAHNVDVDYIQLHAIHLLFCSFVFFLLDECPKSNCTLESIKKLLNTVDRDADESVYEIMLNERKQESRECEQYYQTCLCYSDIDDIYILAQTILGNFMDEPKFCWHKSA